MPDRLDEIFELQQGITREVLAEKGYNLDDLSHSDLTELSRYYILALHKELSEILDNVDGWKLHRPATGEHKRNLLVEEGIDVEKYLVGLLIIWGVTPWEFMATFRAKSKIVADRWAEDKKALA